MSNSKTQPVDIIAELRLRQWARKNYVPADLRRDNEWHAIVLDEMIRKDADLEALERLHQQKTHAVVPLMPNLPEATRIDRAHQPVPAPQFLANPISNEMLIPYYI